MNLIARLSRVRWMREKVQDVEYRLLHPIEPSYQDGHLNWEPRLANELLEAFRSGPTLNFWDVGAAFGVFSLLAAHSRPDAKVTALEPYLPRHVCCRMNTLPASNVRLLKTYLSGHVAPGHETLSSLHKRLGSPPTIIKMDIEGGEFEALMSSLDWLREHKPMMFIEFHEGIMRRQGLNPDALMAAIKDIGYQVSMVDHHEAGMIDNYVIKCV